MNLNKKKSGHIESCIVIGAGISGLLAARALHDRGLKVTVVDKGRRAGGRMATSRVYPEEYMPAFTSSFRPIDWDSIGVFDHGVQYFTSCNSRFGDLVREWRENGWIHPWGRDVPDVEPNQVRYIADQGIRRLPEHLAEGLDLYLDIRIVEVRRRDGGWWIRGITGEEFSADALVMTLPVPQALPILTRGKVNLPAEVMTRLMRIEYDPCFSLLLLLPGPSNVPEPGWIELDDSPIMWIADNHIKGISPHQHTVTIQTNPDYSRNLVDDDLLAIQEQILRAAQPWLGEKPLYQRIHRWRYASIRVPYPDTSLLIDNSPPLVLAGDAFTGGKPGRSRVETAALSGLDAAERLLHYLGRG